MVPRSVLAVVIIGVALTACGPTGVEGQFEERSTMPSCGSLELDQLDLTHDLDEIEGDAVGCMRDAYVAHREAELRITSPTVEGDPIREYWRLHTDGRMELFTDSSDDAFAGGGASWSHTDCAEPPWLREVTCPPEES